MARLGGSTLFRHNKSASIRRAVSSVITTIIISGILLIILVVASFVSANILENQMASTEFEQAKTSMMLLDDVIQDVAARPGAGGYVQFNQRTGGIGIASSGEQFKVIGPVHNATIAKPPTETEGNWTDPERAFSSGGGEAYVTSGKSSPYPHQTYRAYCFDIDITDSIISASLKIVAWCADGKQKIQLDLSSDNGTTWPYSRQFGLSNSPFTYEYALAGWTPTNINQIQTRVSAIGSEKKVSLDWIRVDVFYQTAVVYKSPALDYLVYSAGSQTSGASLNLTGDDILHIGLSDALGYLRVETDQGLKIKLDYYRIRIVELETLLSGNEYTNLVQITFLRLLKGDMAGSGTVNLRLQNVQDRAFSHFFNGSSITIQAQLGGRNSGPIVLDNLDPSAPRTLIMLTEIVIQASTGG